MIQLHYDFFVNFWYYLLVNVNVSDPSSVYNPEYAIKNIPKNINYLLSKYFAVFSHFPFLNDIKNIKDFESHFFSYLEQFDVYEEVVNDFKSTGNNFFYFIETEYEKYKDTWQPEVVFEELNTFKNNHLEKFVNSLKFLAFVTEIEFKGDLHIWLIKCIPKYRGKAVGFQGRCGFAIAVPERDNMDDDIYFTGVHELAHYFTDRLLLQNGLDLSTDKESQSYLCRESLADLVTELYFEDIGKQIMSKWEKKFIPQEILQSILDNYKKLESGIEVIHFGKYSQAFPTEKSVHMVPIKDIYFIEKKNNRIYFFLSLIGRMVGVPMRYFKSLSPIEFGDVYLEHFIKVGLLVPKGYNFFRQSVDIADDQRKFVKKVRFHMTNRCNLRCKYCYLDALTSFSPEGEVNTKQAISYLSKLYADNLDNIEVEFHGGGEPTLMMGVIKEIVEFIDAKTNKRTIRIQTNGLFSKDILEWIVDKKVVISVSIDGDKEINDLQRTEGTDFFDKITANIALLVDRGVSVSTVSVITEYSQDKLDRIYEYIKSLGVKAMMMNPVHSFLGRSQQQDHPSKRDVDLSVFVDNFLNIKKQADKEGIYLVSDFLPDFYEYIPRNYQCDACKPGVGIFSNGDICSCTRAYDLGVGSDNPFVWANIFSGVDINERNEGNLKKRVTENMPECRHCLLKWNCAGDCLLQCYELNGDIYKVYDQRCKAKMSYIVEYLKSLIPTKDLVSNIKRSVCLLHFPAVTPMLPPPGVNFLANYLIKKGVNCEVIDINKDMYYNHKHEWRNTFSFQYNYSSNEEFKQFIDNYLLEATKIILERGYQYIGISCFENTFDIVKRFLELIRHRQIKNIFLGGPDIFMEIDKYKELLSNNLLNALILKEGERKVLEYVLGKKDIEGVITKDNIYEDFLNYKDKETIDINDDLSLLNYISGYVKDNFSHQVIPIYASRGCSFNCSFCSHKILWDGYRFKKPEEVINEMLFYKNKYGCNLFYFTDMLLNGSSDWLRLFVEKLLSLEEKMYWSAYVRIDSVFDQLFCKKLAEAGAVYLSFGIESNSQHVLDVVNKGTKVSDNEGVIPNVSREGIFIHASFIIGLPEESVEDLVKTLDYIKRSIWDIDHVEIFFFENLPQSPGYNFSKEYLEERSAKDRYQLKKDLYDELIVEFNNLGVGVISSKQLYNKEAKNLKLYINDFYKKKYLGEKLEGDSSFLNIAEMMHQIKINQVKLLEEYIQRFTD